MPAIRPWRIINLDESAIDLNRTACEETGGRFSIESDPNNLGKFIVTCTYPTPQSDTQNTPVFTNAGGASVPILVTEEDLEALKRVSAAEVGHFAAHGATQLEGGLAAVVDTVFNRVAHKSYPGSVQGVINQDKQFSPINKLAGWHELASASATVSGIVEEHVASRAQGKSSEIKGATNFLNPYKSGATALQNWGNFVRQNPTAVYGDDSKEDVHYHGFPPNGALPLPYSLSFRGDTFHFDPTGTSAQESAVSTDSLGNELAESIVRVCNEELAKFDSGKKKETEDPQYLHVGDYWKVVGQSFDGRTQIRDQDNELIRPAWSAAFVSYVLLNAGATDFPVSQAHAHYFQHFVGLTNSNLYRAVAQKDETPEVGDIVHYGRGGAKRFDFALAQARYGADKSYTSHSDIVVESDPANRKIITIGGNVGDSVKAKEFRLDAQGKLVDRREKGKDYPWIGILKLVR